MTTLQGKLLRSSEIIHAAIVNTTIPDAEIQFCMRASVTKIARNSYSGENEHIALEVEK